MVTAYLTLSLSACMVHKTIILNCEGKRARTWYVQVMSLSFISFLSRFSLVYSAVFFSSCFLFPLSPSLKSFLCSFFLLLLLLLFCQLAHMEDYMHVCANASKDIPAAHNERLFSDYVARMMRDKTWGGDPELSALSQCLGVDFHVYRPHYRVGASMLCIMN